MPAASTADTPHTDPETAPPEAVGAAAADASSVVAKGTLGRRLLLRIALVFGVVGSLVLALSQLALTRSFDTFERTAAAEVLMRVRTVLLRDSQTMREITQDYGYWDDFYAFMKQPKSSFMEDNFTPASFRNLRIHAVVVLDLAGKPLAVRTVSQGEMLTTLPDAWQDVLTRSGALPRCDVPLDTLVWAEQSPLMVAMTPVRNTAANQPSRGCFLMVRSVDEAYRASVQALTGADFQVNRDAELPTSQWALPNGWWAAQTALQPWPASLIVTNEPSLHAERQWIMGLMTAALAVVCLSAMVGLSWLLHVMVVRRLGRFSDLADKYRATQDWTISWPAKGRDEIDNLGNSLNELVKQVHWQVEHNATHDALTGLANRQGLEQQLAELPFSSFEHRSRTTCLLLIDLDNFKVLNDGFGHDVGNAMLCHVARQLEKAIRQGDSVARIGGDEFAVVLQAVQREAATAFAHRIIENLRTPLTHGELQVATTGSVGLAFCDGVEGPSALMRNADLAMYQAKQQGRDCCAIFNEELKIEAQRRNRLEQALRAAVRDDGIQVVYQPVVDVVRGRVVGIEALARWSLDGEAVPPSEFIPIAEEAGLIGRLGIQVLDRSCALLARLRQQGHQLTCSVNLSVRQFADNSLVEDLPRVVFSHGLPAEAIRFEITESQVAECEVSLSLAMQELNSLGFAFQLDDFGTGQSSLYRLQSLPFHTLKIDRSFVQPLERGDQVMVRTVTELARELQLEVVAEGVETAKQLAALTDMGIARIQGYHIARPMSDTALLRWLSTCGYLTTTQG